MIEIYTKNTCHYCHMAKRLLDAQKLSYTEIDVTFDQQRLEEMIQRSNRRTVPQLFIHNQAVGGFTELAELHHQGKLNSLLNDYGS